MGIKINFNLPDNCSKCGGKLTMGVKRLRGDYTIIERRCYDCKKISKLTLRTIFRQSHLDVINVDEGGRR